MSSEQPVGTSSLVTSSGRLTGRVKWFNNKAGYGFITVTHGERSDSDIFVHHSGVMVSSEQYKYLVQGEYVSFKLEHTPGGSHEYQAGDVSGINNGKLMCETRREFRQARNQHNEKIVEDVSVVRQPRSTRPPRVSDSEVNEVVTREQQDRPRVRGSGPREGNEWTMAKSSRSSGRGTSNEGRLTVDGGKTTGGRGRGRPPRSKEEA